MRVMSCAAIVSLAWLTTSAIAANDLPKRTDDFLSYCQQNSQNFERCEDFVVNTDFAFTMGVMGKRICDPATLSADGVTHAVLDWLTAHSETHDKPRFDMTVDALTSLFPCSN